MLSNLMRPRSRWRGRVLGLMVAALFAVFVVGPRMIDQPLLMLGAFWCLGYGGVMLGERLARLLLGRQDW